MSPDCHALEERFRSLIETNAADTEKLRNLSVSSADFNFEAGGSLPNTPLRTPRSFHFPPSTLASGGGGLPAPTVATSAGSLDLSLKKVTGSDSEGSEAGAEAVTGGGGRVPTINVIKPEPEDPGEAAETLQRGRSPPSSFPFVAVTKSSPVYQGEPFLIGKEFWVKCKPFSFQPTLLRAATVPTLPLPPVSRPV